MEHPLLQSNHIRYFKNSMARSPIELPPQYRYFDSQSESHTDDRADFSTQESPEAEA